MSHRPTFNTGNNAYWSIDDQGNFFFDGELSDKRAVPDWALDAFESHKRFAHHPDCAICQRDAKRKAVVTDDEAEQMIARFNAPTDTSNWFDDYKTPAQDDDLADLKATQASAL